MEEYRSINENSFVAEVNMASVNKSQKGSNGSCKKTECGKATGKFETKAERDCNQFIYSQRLPNQLHTSIYLSK
jgi:hypothetical protein